MIRRIACCLLAWMTIIAPGRPSSRRWPETTA
jgi:hypothetical protein